MTQFYVTLPSNVINTRKNTTAEYRIDLARTLEFSGQWEVGLAAMQYPFTWDNFVGESFYFNLPKAPQIEVKVPGGNYENISELTEILNQQFESTLEKNSAFLGNKLHMTAKDIMKKHVLRFSYNTTLKRIELKMVGLSNLLLSEHLRYTLGFSHTIQSFTNDWYLADYPPDMSTGFTSLYVYTDIIKPQLVGNIETPLLRIVPIKGSYGEIIVKDFSPIHYVDLLNRRFNSISVAIKDDRDTPIRFLFGKTVLKLHFRKKQYI